MEGLVSGADCGPINPLARVIKHAEGDRSLQQDRIAGPSSSRLQHLPGTSVGGASQSDLALARQFFESGRHVGPAFGAPNPMELARMQELVGQPMSDANERWIMEQQQQLRAFEAQGWAAEFSAAPSPQMSRASSSQPSASRPDFQPSAQFSQMGMPMRMGMGMGMYGSSFTPAMQPQINGKGKSREADFEAAFAQVVAAQSETQSAKIEEIPEGQTGLEAALDNANLQEPQSEFKQFWDEMQKSDLPPPEADMAKWEAEFQQLMSAQRDELDHDYGAAMKQAWEGGIGDYGDLSDSQPLKFDANGIPILDDYVFETNNKHVSDASSESPLAKAKALLEQNGSLSDVASLLEAAIQKGELGEGGYEAWVLLGETRNMDEREEAGMRALTEGVKRAEAAGAPGVGMLSLAISYTNESMDRASHTMLLRWLQSRFPGHPIPAETIAAISTHSTWDTHDRLTQVFIDLARRQHTAGEMDPDVQIALGILFYTNNEYDRAKDCFESALSVRPKDYTLWNRLGSCLSNGSHPEEALGAYREALQLRPTYTRAIYNVGVACLNIGAHKEAAEHFLSGLTMQESAGQTTSDQLWQTLRRTFLQMNRLDLAEMTDAGKRGSLDVFRNEFDFYKGLPRPGGL
ncbi:TPR-REGION domain-containing protein [Mycena kentingensis (nom. inval.)]|nr:TPR-REGION domain-containing protein [Mycena kentingensis (nom. inval.)]